MPGNFNGLLKQPMYSVIVQAGIQLFHARTNYSAVKPNEKTDFRSCPAYTLCFCYVLGQGLSKRAKRARTLIFFKFQKRVLASLKQDDEMGMALAEGLVFTIKIC
jgi:hypothetical protein